MYYHKVGRQFFILLCLAGIAAAGISTSGCATAEMGNQRLTASRVAQIKKGVTTEAQVIKLLGQPDSIAMMGNGGRMLTYTRMESSANESQLGLEMIPIAGAFIPANTSSTSRTRMLQVLIGKNHIVQDFQYSDNAQQTNTTESGFFGGHVQQKAITPTTGP